MRGSEGNFEALRRELKDTVKNYELGKIKHYQFADLQDAIFAKYDWGKQEFFAELRKRLGKEGNTKSSKKPAVSNKNK